MALKLFIILDKNCSMLKMKNSIFIKVSGNMFLALFALVVCACSSDDNNDDPTIDPPDNTNLNRLPLFSVNTNGISIVDEPKIAGNYTITEDGETLHSGSLGIEIRGQSSQLFPKKSYGLETWDVEGNDINATFFDMPEEEDWILYAPYSDKTLMRNVLIYDLASEMNLYATRTKFVELEINEQFKGTYVFMEKMKRDSGRIDINKLKDDENEGEDLTGGYIIKIDKADAEGYTSLNSFNSRYGSTIDETGSPIRFLYDYPKADDITEAQKTYISTYITDFEDALVSDTFADPDTGYASFIDVDSFIDFFILNEISNNVDGYRISTYMHKDKNEKLKMGPIWDFNLAFGNADYCSGGETNVWAYKFNDRCPGDFWFVPFWWDRMLEDPAFVSKLQDRWNTLRGGVLSDATILGKVAANVDTLKDSGAVASNFGTWPIFSSYVWPNNFIGNNYDEEVGYFTQWIQARNSWLDTSINAL